MQTAEAAKSTRPLERKVKVPLKINPVHQTALELHEDYRKIGDNVVVVTIQSRDYVKTLVYHEPIGSTDLPHGSWVVDQIGNIPTLLVAAKDPAAQRKQEARVKLRSHILATAGLMEIDSKGNTVFASGPDKGKTVSEVHRAAETAAENKRTLLYDAYVKECAPGKAVSRKDWPCPEVRTDSFIAIETSAAIQKVENHLEKSQPYKDGLQKIEPKKYVTLGGPNNNLPQERVAFAVGRTYSRQQVVDAVASHLLSTSRQEPFPRTGGKISDPMSVVDEIINPPSAPAASAIAPVPPAGPPPKKP